MPAYIVVMNDVTDPSGYGTYLEAARAARGAHNPVVRAFADSVETLEGESPHGRCVIIEFEDREKAEAWYRSPEYQAAVKTRLGATEGFGILVEGR